MRIIFVWAGIVLFVGSILLIASNYDDIKIEQKGLIVKMRILALPASCLGTKSKHYVTLNYKGEDFIKRIGGKFCDDHHVGELVDIKYLDGSSKVLFPDESVVSNLISFGILGICGIVITLSQWKKIRK